MTPVSAKQCKNGSCKRHSIHHVTCWVTAVAYRGVIDHLRVHPTEALAQWDLTQYLKSYHQYRGASDFTAAQQWLSERDNDFSVVIESLLLSLRKPPVDPIARLDQFLRQRGFIVQTFNPRKSPHQFEAWAYEGPLDFGVAQAVRFGLGSDPVDAIHALNQQLADLAANSGS